MVQTPTFHASSAHILAGQLIAAFRDAEGRDCPAVSMCWLRGGRQAFGWEELPKGQTQASPRGRAPRASDFSAQHPDAL